MGGKWDFSEGILPPKWFEDALLSILEEKTKIFTRVESFSGRVANAEAGGNLVLFWVGTQPGDQQPVSNWDPHRFRSCFVGGCHSSSDAAMIYLPAQTRVFLAAGNTDMRKAINGLSLLVEGEMELDPFSGHLFVFCNRSRTIVKILYWDRNGFCLWQKRLEKQRFQWPKNRAEVLEIQARELGFLLEGLDLRSVRPHKILQYATLVWVFGYLLNKFIYKEAFLW